MPSNRYVVGQPVKTPRNEVVRRLHGLQGHGEIHAIGVQRLSLQIAWLAAMLDTTDASLVLPTPLQRGVQIIERGHIDFPAEGPGGTVGCGHQIVAHGL